MRGISLVLTALGAVFLINAPGVLADILPHPLAFRFSRDGPGFMVCRDGKEFQCGTGCCENDTVCFENAACCPKGEKCTADFIGQGSTQSYCKSAWEDGCPGSNICCPDDAPRCQQVDFYGAGCWASTLDKRGVIPTASAPPSSAVTVTGTSTSCTEESPHQPTQVSTSSSVPVSTSSAVTYSASTDVKPTTAVTSIPISSSCEETPALSIETPPASKTSLVVTTSVESSQSTVVHPTTALSGTPASSSTEDVSTSLQTQQTTVTESSSCEQSLIVTIVTSSTTAAPTTMGDKSASSLATVPSSYPVNDSTTSVTQTSTQSGKTVRLTIFPSHSTSQVSSPVLSPSQSRNTTTIHTTTHTTIYTTVHSTTSIESVTNSPFWKNSTVAKPTNGETNPTGWVTNVPVGNVTSTVWSTSKPSASTSKYPTSLTVPLGNAASSVVSPASGLSVTVSALAIFFLFLSGRLNATNAAILILDATITKSMLVVAFVTAYVFFGGLAAAVGGTSLAQFLAVY